MICLAAIAHNPPKVIGLGGEAITPTIIITTTLAMRVGWAIAATATVSDDVGVMLVAWRADGQTVAGRQRAWLHVDASALLAYIS